MKHDEIDMTERALIELAAVEERIQSRWRTWTAEIRRGVARS